MMKEKYVSDPNKIERILNLTLSINWETDYSATVYMFGKTGGLDIVISKNKDYDNLNDFYRTRIYMYGEIKSKSEELDEVIEQLEGFLK